MLIRFTGATFSIDNVTDFGESVSIANTPRTYRKEIRLDRGFFVEFFKKCARSFDEKTRISRIAIRENQPYIWCTNETQDDLGNIFFIKCPRSGPAEQFPMRKLPRPTPQGADKKSPSDDAASNSAVGDQNKAAAFGAGATLMAVRCRVCRAGNERNVNLALLSGEP